MENSNKSPVSAFMKGFGSSAVSGALMSGIFYGLGLAIQAVAGTALFHMTVASALTFGPMMVLAVALFGGVMGVMRNSREAKEEDRIRSETISRERDLTPVMVPAMGAAVAADKAADQAPDAPQAAAAETSQWRDRMGVAARTDRVAEILASRDMDDKSRASAILAEREQAAAAQAQR